MVKSRAGKGGLGGILTIVFLGALGYFGWHIGKFFGSRCLLSCHFGRFAFAFGLLDWLGLCCCCCLGLIVCLISK